MPETEFYEQGQRIRREVLGDEYVDRVMASADEFGKPIQDFVTECVWGAIWSREELDRRARSLVNIAMVTALNRPHEIRLHVGGALRNGCTRVEVREVLLQAAAYCGAPAGIDAFRVAREVFAEIDAAN